jgi:hypothetical protein
VLFGLRRDEVAVLVDGDALGEVLPVVLLFWLFLLLRIVQKLLDTFKLLLQACHFCLGI